MRSRRTSWWRRRSRSCRCTKASVPRGAPSTTSPWRSGGRVQASPDPNISGRARVWLERSKVRRLLPRSVPDAGLALVELIPEGICEVAIKGGDGVAFNGDLEELVERRTRAEAELVGHAGILECCSEVPGQGASDKAAKDVPNHQGTQSAGRLPECDDAPKPCGSQDRRRHGGVGEPEGGLMEQAEVAGVVQHQTQVLVRHA